MTNFSSVLKGFIKFSRFIFRLKWTNINFGVRTSVVGPRVLIDLPEEVHTNFNTRIWVKILRVSMGPNLI